MARLAILNSQKNKSPQYGHLKLVWCTQTTSEKENSEYDLKSTNSHR